jgi:hypothetical protein
MSQAVPLAALRAANTTSIVTCHVDGCNQTRLHPRCGNAGFCCQHCKAMGGCGLPTHFVSTTSSVPSLPTGTVPAAPSAPSSAQLPIADMPLASRATSSIAILPSTHHHQLGSPSRPSTSAVPSSHQVPSGASVTSTSLDARPDPRYASQMPAIFTSQFAVQQRLEEEKRQNEAERLANIKRTSQEVIVHVWSVVCRILHVLLGISSHMHIPVEPRRRHHLCSTGRVYAATFPTDSVHACGCWA